jgi:quercetin dioxygenase-like cupin family protein
MVEWIARAVLTAVLIVATPGFAGAQIGLERKIVLQQDAAIPGYETLVAEVTIAVGGREGRHSHPGILIGYVLEGELTLELEGRPPKIVKPGEAALIEPGLVHEGINKGSVPIKALVTFLIEKGKPLSTPAR